MKILVTGTAGFIGFHTVLRLLKEGFEVVGLDNINNYYDTQLKYDRLAHCGISRAEIAYAQAVASSLAPGYRFIKMDLTDKEGLQKLFEQEKPEAVIHLAAQAGVRHSLTHPDDYVQANLVGFVHLLECIRSHPVRHFVFASSSSVYGLNENQPFSASDTVDHPVSIYAASKKSNELLAHSYSHLFGIPTTGLRFFSAYGPWGRPDMALYIFVKAIYEGRPIKVFNHGKMKRDFTYIDDIVEYLHRIVQKAPAGDPLWDAKKPNPSSSRAPFRIYNVGNGTPVPLMDFIDAIEVHVGRKAQKDFLPMLPGDVPMTCADVKDLQRDFEYQPKVYVQEGVGHCVQWYNGYHRSDPSLSAKGIVGNV